MESRIPSLIVVLVFVYATMPDVSAVALLNSSYTTSPPTIDGSLGAGEWSNGMNITLNGFTTSANTIRGELYIMNNNTHLFMAAVIDDSAQQVGTDYAVFMFDNGHDHTATLGGEDAAEFGYYLSAYGDDYWGTSAPTDWWVRDVGDGNGTAHGNGSSSYSSGQYVYEFSKPLNSSEARDMAVALGSAIGFRIETYDGVDADNYRYPQNTVDANTSRWDEWADLNIASSSDGNGTTAGLGVINLSDSQVEAGSLVYAHVPLTSGYNDSFSIRILADGVNRWNHTENVTSAPTTVVLNISFNTSGLSVGDHVLNFTLYNSSGAFQDWNTELLTVSAANSCQFTVNKTLLNEEAVIVGNVTLFLINVTNIGSSNITNLSIADNYDVDLNYTSASVTPASIDYSNRLVSWVNASMNLTSGGSYLVYVNFSAIASAQTVANIVNVSAYDSLGNASSSSMSTQITILPESTNYAFTVFLGWNLISIPLG